MELDGLKYHMQEASKQSGLALGELLEQPVTVNIEPMFTDVKVWQEWLNSTVSPLSAAVYMQFDGDYSGSGYLLFPQQSRRALLKLLQEMEADEINDEAAFREALSEIGNVILNVCIGSLVNAFHKKVVYQPPQVLAIPQHMDQTFELSIITGDDVYLLSSSLSVNTGVITAYIMVSMRTDHE